MYSRGVHFTRGFTLLDLTSRSSQPCSTRSAPTIAPHAAVGGLIEGFHEVLDLGLPNRLRRPGRFPSSSWPAGMAPRGQLRCPDGHRVSAPWSLVMWVSWHREHWRDRWGYWHGGEYVPNW